LSRNNRLLDNICMCGNPHKNIVETQIREKKKQQEIKSRPVPVGFLRQMFCRYSGRREWIRTNDPYHVKVVL
jgi:hypothetical protein